MTNSQSFRDFVQDLLTVEDAVEITTPVSPHLEAAAITRRVYETRGPAPLFCSLTEGETGFRILGAPAGMSPKAKGEHGRLAAHLGLDRTAGPRQIVEHLIRAMHADPVPPRIVESGPCKENIWRGDEVDLRKLPVPLLHAEDGGRYLGTYGFHVVKTPDASWTSWSVGRTMLHGPTTLVGPAMPEQHIGIIHSMWRDLGERTPWAMVLGAPPAALAAAGMPLPAHVSEDGYVGALTGLPVDVVETEQGGLQVPATSEIVLEGWISAEEIGPEGPMGEYHGYSFPEGKLQPVFHVETITFRDEAILPICVAGLPPEENHTIWGTMISAVALDVLRRAGLPISMAWCSYEAATCWIALAVDTKKLSHRIITEKEFVDSVAKVLFDSHAGWLVPKVILIGDDVDITDINQVVWAMATRHHPSTGTYLYPESPGIPMAPYLTAIDHAAGSGGKAITSCLFPGEFTGTSLARAASFGTSFPQELQEDVLSKWTAYGFAAD
ncbi:UbiD family decarboxylase [Arthrobacter sp. fls2-241-R2A-172]|uniref:UbiD family decarboxylase n=1 Tax=Arthrobacter sp. fls2-241-R2A-172 TaxID=3040325 RepID=UPI002550A907|nr:UbiD family decarboxylase [Arthrobacter sp. fls2-241-R2A-172]